MAVDKASTQNLVRRNIVFDVCEHLLFLRSSTQISFTLKFNILSEILSTYILFRVACRDDQILCSRFLIVKQSFCAPCFYLSSFNCVYY